MSAERPAARYVLPETVLLAGIACADLLYTVYLVATQQAREANPFMNAVLLRCGPAAFVGLKALLVMVPVAIAEGARRRHPEFVRLALRVAIMLYITLYAVGHLVFNVL
jgi:hypothetical protein